MMPLLTQIQDLIQDCRLGISTREPFDYQDHYTHYGDAVPYQTIPYSMLSQIFKRVLISEKDHFVDYGCGKGRVICFAALFPFQKVTGIEIVPELAALAKKNAATLRHRRASIVIEPMDAIDYACRQDTVFFFFNPFGEKTMEAVLNQIRKSLNENPRPVQIIYFNPVHAKQFLEEGWLRMTDSLTITRLGFTSMGRPAYVEFYKNEAG